MVLALFPGSFDPPTLGHLDIIRRAAGIFNRLNVVVMLNSAKKSFFSVEDRVSMLKKCTGSLGNVEVGFSDKLLVDYAKNVGANVAVKGLRAPMDFDIEFQMALINREMNPGLETLFIPTSHEYIYMSSSLVREIGSKGGKISGFVPEEIALDLERKFQNYS